MTIRSTTYGTFSLNVPTDSNVKEDKSAQLKAVASSVVDATKAVLMALGLAGSKSVQTYNKQ